MLIMLNITIAGEKETAIEKIKEKKSETMKSKRISPPPEKISEKD